MEKAKARGFGFYAQQQDWFLWVLIVLGAVATYVVDKWVYHTNRPYEVTDTTIAYTHHEDTIAVWLAPLIPAIVFIFHMVYWELTKTHLPLGHRLSSIFRFFTSNLASLVVVGFHTELFKTLCGRLRPDFLARCYGQDVILKNGTSTIDPNSDCLKNGLEDDGRKSFPSGHASCTLAISLHAAYYVLWCLHFRVGKAGNKGYHNQSYVPGTGWIRRFVVELVSFLDLLLLLFQLAWAWGVGISRFRDNRHHPSDIVGGFVLALTYTPLFLLRTISQQAYWDKYIIDATSKQEVDELELLSHADGTGPAPKDATKIDIEAPLPRHLHNYSDGYSMGGTPIGPASNSNSSQFGKPAATQQQQQQTVCHAHMQPQQQQHSSTPPPLVKQASLSVPGSVSTSDDQQQQQQQRSHAVPLAAPQPAQQYSSSSSFANPPPPVNGSISATDSIAPLVPAGAQSSDSLLPAVPTASMGGGATGAPLTAATTETNSGGGTKERAATLSEWTQHISWTNTEKKQVEKVANA